MGNRNNQKEIEILEEYRKLINQKPKTG